MTASNSNAGVSGILRLGVGSAADAPLTGVQTEGPRPDAGARRNRTLPVDSLTEHIERDTKAGLTYAASQARECRVCPPWVVACVHYGDKVKRLIDRNLLPPNYVRKFPSTWSGPTYEEGMRMLRAAEEALLAGGAP